MWTMCAITSMPRISAVFTSNAIFRYVIEKVTTR